MLLRIEASKKNSTKPLSPDKQKLSDGKDAVKKAIDLMKTNHDKIHRELTSVKAIESKMRSKAWDTSGPIEYLKKETMISGVSTQSSREWRGDRPVRG